MFVLLFVTALAALPSQVWADEAEAVLQPQFGKQTITVPAGGELTFYDPKGTAAMSSSQSNNTLSMTVFRPAEEGLSVQITFEQFDVQNDGASYPGKVVLFSGEPDADNTFEWPTSIYNVGKSSTLPEGSVLETLDGTSYTGATYYSTSPDGILSVGMHWVYAKRCEGWTAKVRCVRLENMTVTGAGSAYSHVAATPDSKTAVALAGVYVDADGVMNADRLTSVSFRLTQNEGVVDPLALHLYEGSEAGYKGGTPVETSVTADGDGYTFTLDRTLMQGRNSLTLAGDILGTAGVGAAVAVEITSVKTAALPDGVSPFAAATPVTVNNPAIATIEALPQTVIVGETPLALYDDGGADGKISAGFNGTITFLPGTDGKKVQVDFASVKLFEGSIYYQYLNVYNGTEAKPENLLRRVMSGTTALIHSTSADGALTIELANNGTSSTADGIEATVSLFEPQPMKAAGISTAEASAATVCAGDEGQAVIRLNISTDGTEPALSATKFSFSTCGTADIVSRATLYYTKDADNLSTAVMVGQTDVTADDFDIVADESLTLAEGDNRFWLAYDIDAAAVNGQTVGAALKGVTLGGETVAADEGSYVAARTVENIVLSHSGQGTVTKTVNGSIAFRTRPASEYSSNYEPGTDDRINTFVPMHDGMICQIDFSSFDLYYASASYGAKAKFRVYSGQGTTGELLWELASADDKSTGPGRVLRSTAADGSLTVVFNTTQTSSYYMGKGFDATVSEYMSQPMRLDTVIVEQASTAVIEAGTAGHDLLAIDIKTTGDLSQQSLESVTLDLKGLQANMAKAYIYNVGTKNVAPAADAEPVAVAEITAGDAQVTVSLDTPATLAEGDNWFRLVVDPAATVKADDVIDAAVSAVTLDGTIAAVAKGDPDGCRIVKNIYLLKQGQNGEVVVPGGVTLQFYDDGGPDASSSKGFDGTVTFVPGAEGEVIKMDFRTLKLSSSDKLTVYNGSEVCADSLVASYSGSAASATYLVSDAVSGKMTVSFQCNSTYSQPDFAIDVKSYTKKPMTVMSMKTTAIAPETVLRGQGDVAMIRVDIEAEGDYDPLTVSAFSIGSDAAGAISAVKVYATDTISAFAANDLYAAAVPAGDGTFSAEGEYTIGVNGTYRFWVVADVAADAVAGNSISLNVAGITAGGAAVTPAAGNDVTATATLREGVHGTITVGAGADYGTIQGAIDAIAGGIDGPVTVNILRGIYNEQVTVPEIAGASERNTITIQSETGNWNDVRIYHDRYSEPVYSDDKMFHEYGVFTIAGADYVTLRGIELTTTDVTYPGIVHIKNISRHVTIDSCYVHTRMTTSYSDDINLIYTYAQSEANRNNDYITVRNCLLEGGYIGVRLTGTSTTALPKQRGGVIENNVLRNQGSKAIYVYDELGARITGNIIENNAAQTASTYYGIDINARNPYTESTVISGNRFNIATGNAIDALYVRQHSGTAEAPMLVINNEVNVNSVNASSYGIQVGDVSSHLYIAHNTVRMTGSAARAALWFNNTNPMNEGVTAYNNILLNETGGNVYRFYKAGNEQTVTMGSNVVNTTGDIFAYSGADVATFDDWTTLTGEAGSHNEAVAFLSDDILEPAGEGSLLTALPLTYVATDINGTPRAAQPTIGAYEYNASVEAPAAADGYPVAKNITDTTAVVAVIGDLNGQMFAVVRHEGETAPTADEVIAADTVAVMYAGRETQVTIERLATDETYVPYVVLRSLRGTVSEVLVGKPFVASGEIIVEIPNAAVTAEGDTIEEGNMAMLKATVTAGTAPFTLSWQNGRHEEIGTAELADLGESVIWHAAGQCDDYIVTVTDANGKSAADTCRVVVRGEAAVATFDNLWLETPGSWWCGPDTKGQLSMGAWGDMQQAGSFVSGSYSFSNTYSLDWYSWSGFAYSNSTSTVFESITTDQYNAATGGGYDGSENFAVAFTGGVISVLNSEEGDSIRGTYITNTAYTLNSITTGDAYSKAFEEGDWLKVTFTGVHADGTTSSVDYYLADYRSANAADRYYLDTWQWVDLRALGKVKEVSFALDGSDSGQWGLNTPAYFCLDNFNGHRVIGEAPVQNCDGTIDIAPLFSFDADEATVTYAITDVPEAADGTEIELTADGKLTVSGLSGELTVVVSATQKGRIQYLRIPVDYVNAIDSVRADDSAEAEIYDLGGRRVDTRRDGISIVRMKDGTIRKVVRKAGR